VVSVTLLKRQSGKPVVLTLRNKEHFGKNAIPTIEPVLRQGSTPQLAIATDNRGG
jgi:hypothetical protein